MANWSGPTLNMAYKNDLCMKSERKVIPKWCTKWVYSWTSGNIGLEMIVPSSFKRPGETGWITPTSVYTPKPTREHKITPLNKTNLVSWLAQLHSYPKEVHIDFVQFSRWPRVTDPYPKSWQVGQMQKLLSRPIDKIKMTLGRVGDLGTSEN